MKKRILFVHHVSAIGGGSYCMLNLVRSLDRTRYEPYVLLGEDGPLAREFEKDGIPVDILPEMSPLPYNKALFRRSCLERYFAQPKSSKAFDRYLSEHPGYQIIYLNNMLLCPYLKIAASHGRKAVIHIREHWSRNEHPLQFLNIRKKIGKWADCVIAINEYCASRVPGCAGKTHVVYDWIDLSGRYESMPYDDIFGCDTSRLKVFLYVGGFNLIKGINEIVQVFHESAGEDCRLLIVGDRPESGMKPSMARACDIIGKDSRIKCIPATYRIRHLIEQAYFTVTFFTIPHANLFLAESLICNTPAIAAGTEEAYEYSENGELAALFPMKDKRAFARMLCMSDEDYSRLRNRVAASSGKVAERFDKGRNVLLWHVAMESMYTQNE